MQGFSTKINDTLAQRQDKVPGVSDFLTVTAEDAAVLAGEQIKIEVGARENQKVDVYLVFNRTHCAEEYSGGVSGLSTRLQYYFPQDAQARKSLGAHFVAKVVFLYQHVTNGNIAHPF